MQHYTTDREHLEAATAGVEARRPPAEGANLATKPARFGLGVPEALGRMGRCERFSLDNGSRITGGSPGLGGLSRCLLCLLSYRSIVLHTNGSDISSETYSADPFQLGDQPRRTLKSVSGTVNLQDSGVEESLAIECGAAHW